MNTEDRAIESLRANPRGLRSDLIDFLPKLFEQLRAIECKAVNLSPGVMYESMWGCLGLMARAYQLMICSTEQLANRNFNGFYASFRALVETLCAVVWATAKPGRISSLVQENPISIGKILNAGYHKYPDLKHIYILASGIAHPNRDGHLLSPLKGDDDRIFTPFALEFSEWFAKRKLDLLLDMSVRIIDEFELFIKLQSSELTKGKVVAFRLLETK
jgi:hypothetical protein